MTWHPLLAESGPVGEIARTFGVDWPHLFAQIVSFSIVCVLLKKFAYGPVLAMLEERRRRIAQGLADAEQARSELEKARAAHHETMTKLNAQAAKLLEEARQAAARAGELETRKASVAAEGIVTKAREAATLERGRMFEELKGEMGRLVILAAEAATGKVLTSDDQRVLADEASRQLVAGGSPR
ncbi:MAG TPA: F0F1 ATP synthase subunit B [Planctomycetia bacterium]|nr:F0F1 ATP synthase subunit B [Planctomycetia bacterium]